MQITKYDQSFKQSLKNGIILGFSGFFGNLLFLLIYLLPIPFILFFSSTVSIVVISIYFLFFNGFSTLLVVEWYQYLFDEKIHKNSLMDEYKRGLTK